MAIQDQLAYALARNDQEPNKLLAKKIANEGDQKAVEALVAFFQSDPKQRAQSDTILTLAYVAEQAPHLVYHQTSLFLSQLDSPVNRVIFGSMIAMSHIAHLAGEKLFESLPIIIDAMDTGTVVTRDYGFKIMVTLYQDEKLQEDLFLLMQEQLMKAPSNQLGQYAERLMEVLNKSHLNSLIETLEARREDITNEHHIKRLNKNLKKLYTQL